MRVGRVLLGLAATMALGGCMLPDYYSPGGFSSTYHKRVYPYFAHRTPLTANSVGAESNRPSSPLPRATPSESQ